MLSLSLLSSSSFILEGVIGVSKFFQYLRASVTNLIQNSVPQSPLSFTVLVFSPSVPLRMFSLSVLLLSSTSGLMSGLSLRQ